jgi:pyrroline-5-carboxylate reductase
MLRVLEITEWKRPAVSAGAADLSTELTVAVDVTNNGEYAANHSEVVMVFAKPKALREALTPAMSVPRQMLLGFGAAAVASFLAAVMTEIYLCDVCSCQELLRRNGRG